MAYNKRVQTRGVEASYFRLIAFRWDAQTREASALFSLYVDKAHSDRSKPSVPAAERDRPLIDIAAKLRVSGDAFDQYLSPEALQQGAANVGSDIVAHLYAAAKDASKLKVDESVTNPQLHIVSDFGHDLFATARAV